MAKSLDPRVVEANQRAYREGGYTGEFRDGLATAWKQSQGGDIARNIDQLKAKYNQPPQYDQGGVAPVGRVADYTPYEKQALVGFAENNPATQAGQDYRGAMNMTQQAAAPLTDERFNSLYNRYSSPFLQDVRDRTTTRINEQADQTRSKLMDKQAGRRSFGDSSSAIQQSELEKNRLGQVADTDAALNQANFQQATGNALKDYGLSGSMGISGAGQYGSLSNMNMNAGRQGLSDQLMAGRDIRGFNQTQLDVANQAIGERRGYGNTQLNNMGNFLGAFPVGGGGSSFQGTSNQTKMGAGLMTAGGALGQFQQSGVNRDLTNVMNANVGGIW